MKHIEFAKLVEKFEGRLSSAEELEIGDHILTCRHCEIEVRKLADFFAYAELKDREPVPQAVTAGILNIYQRRPIPVEPIAQEPGGFGFLIFDDWATALNERFSGLDTRQMLFRVNNFDIDIRIELIENKCRLAGQLFPASIGAIATISAPELTVSALLNEFGEFSFDLVHQGVYDLKVEIGTEELIIEKVPLQQ